MQAFMQAFHAAYENFPTAVGKLETLLFWLDVVNVPICGHSTPEN